MITTNNTFPSCPQFNDFKQTETTGVLEHPEGRKLNILPHMQK